MFGALAINKMYSMYSKHQAREVYREMQVSVAQRMKAGKYQNPDSNLSMPYRLYIPDDAKAADSNRKFPVILALHSGRGRGNDNVNQIDRTVEILLSDMLQGIEPVFVVAPQAEKRTHWVNYDKFTPPFLNFDQQVIPQSENLKTAIKLLKDIIARYPIDPQRVYITGISMGGEGTWDALSYYPDLFAAAIPLNGAGDPVAVRRVGMMPIRFFHGSEDIITPVENSRALHQSLSRGPNNATYQELDGAAHDIRDLVYSRELFLWMLAQRADHRQ